MYVWLIDMHVCQFSCTRLMDMRWVFFMYCLSAPWKSVVFWKAHIITCNLISQIQLLSLSGPVLQGLQILKLKSSSVDSLPYAKACHFINPKWQGALGDNEWRARFRHTHTHTQFLSQQLFSTYGWWAVIGSRSPSEHYTKQTFVSLVFLVQSQLSIHYTKLVH